MRNLLFFRRGEKSEEKGIVLIAVILVSTLVMALFVMSFSNAIIGRFVVQAHSDKTQAKQCAEGAFAITHKVIGELQATNLPVTKEFSMPLPAGVTIRDPVSLYNKIRNIAPGGPNNNPDITIVCGPGAGSTTNVDIEFLFDRSRASEGEHAFALEYHRSTGGTVSGGIFYYITAVTTFRGVSTTVTSAHYSPSF